MRNLLPPMIVLIFLVVAQVSSAQELTLTYWKGRIVADEFEVDCSLMVPVIEEGGRTTWHEQQRKRSVSSDRLRKMKLQRVSGERIEGEKLVKLFAERQIVVELPEGKLTEDYREILRPEVIVSLDPSVSSPYYRGP